jgi:hypothetical protein
VGISSTDISLWLPVAVAKHGNRQPDFRQRSNAVQEMANGSITWHEVAVFPLHLEKPVATKRGALDALWQPAERRLTGVQRWGREGVMHALPWL